MLIYLKRAVAEDLGENRCREVGDDRQDDCYAGCDDDENVDFIKFNHKKCVASKDGNMAQTHDTSSRIRNLAAFLVLTMWALYNCVAPGHDHDGDDDGNDDWMMAPDGPHGKELAGLVLLIADVQRRASAHVVVTPWKGSLSQILVLAVLFVFSVLAL